MTHQRQGDNSAVLFQSARFYAVNSAWYFSTRECEDKGPYPSKSDAENAFKDFVAVINRPDFPSTRQHPAGNSKTKH